MTFPSSRDICGDELKQLSETALRQIADRNYDAEMKSMGIKTIYRYGVAFCGKNVEVALEE